ncbi:peptidoglycan DD-metalloendopeptidase family protein [Virgibacillus sp. MSP4-1]|uniref:peptidoglycan DD-metalloendopeptidase family protein n=1 Tax=Virgibacillus sp. MSP4-1 TaxID=2700081 RepID=UPI0003A26712|nr:peptidoglycan DD-metalloendopeptidase family protein [Virgibacillus sp. MSP4-1]QHS23806.1 peptidoglycan DD-metalloendopeptidase family protein [Virgibacillus sp. MSP4-1]
MKYKKKRWMHFNGKVIFLVCMALLLSVSTVHAETDSFPKIYHVYVSGEHLGSVGDKEIVESFLKEQVEQAEKNYDENLNLAVNEEITYISEFAFQPSFNNKKVLNNLKNKITFNVKAQKLIVGEEVIGYFKTKEMVKKLLKEFQSKYLTEDQLKRAKENHLLNIELENKQDKKTESNNDKQKENPDKQQAPLSAGESKMLDLSLTEEIHIEEDTANPDELLTIEQGLKLLEQDKSSEKVHVIEKGEFLRSVANDYDLSINEILDLNPELEEDEILQIGQEIKVENQEPIVQVVTVEEKMEHKDIDYDTEYEETSTLYAGDRKVKQQGEKGKKEIQYKVVKRNGKVTKKIKLNEEILKEPVEKIVLKGTKTSTSNQSASGPARKGSGQFQWPAAGGIITSYMGPRGGGYHSGIDISGVSNRTLYAADGGVVTTAGYQSNGYGNRVVINHGNGYKTTYNHLASIRVSSGQSVKKGQAIGVMGNTGYSTGVHLHFEILKNGSYVNPMSFY